MADKKFVQPKRGIRDYKTPEQYLKQLFRLNKEEIIKQMTRALDENVDQKRAYQIFKQNIKELGGDKITKIAISKYEKSTLFLDYPEIAGKNVRNALRSNQLWEDFRRLNRHQKWDINLLVYQGNNQYLYNDKIMISFKNSPETIEMYKI